MKDNKTQNSPPSSSWFRENKKKLVGVGYLIGDTAIAINGLLEARATEDPKKRKDMHGEVVTGLGWAIGGVAMAKYGNRPLDQQMEALEQRLAAYFEEQGITLSEEMLLKAKQQKDRSFFRKFEDFCYKHPTQILNAVYGVLALPLIKSGFSQQYKPVKASQGSFGIKDLNKVPTLGMGVLVLAGALAGLLIKHKSKEQIEEEGLGSLRGAMHENSSRINGGLYLANNYFTIQGARKNKAAHKDSTDPLTKNMYLLRTITAGSYIGSNILLSGGASADKTEATLAADAKQEILASCTQIINSQEPTVRDQLVAETAEYLCKQDELGFSQHSPKKLAEMIRQGFDSQQAQTPKPAPEQWAGRIRETDSPQEKGR